MMTLHDLTRYYRNAGLVGEDRAAITITVALAGDASVVLRGYPGTGKTHGARVAIDLLPPEIVCQIDMVSALGIWSKPIAARVAASRIVYLPEQQNAGDNDEVVKVLKKWGDGVDAERAKSADFGNDVELTVLPCRTFLSTAAITNKAHEASFDLESARRVVKVNTDPSENATDKVLKSKADVLVRGHEKTRVLNPIEAQRVRQHVRRTMLGNHDAVARVRFFGARELLEAIPKTFPESRSAFALFEKVLLGIARWYADSEVRVGDEVFLSPQRVAETWAFYGDVLLENALKWETSDREILDVFPQASWNGDAIAPDSCADLQFIMRKLKPFGLTDAALVRRQLAKLVLKGFLNEADGFQRKRWHRTALSDVANFIDWNSVRAACAKGAEAFLQGEARQRYEALLLEAGNEARSARVIQNPITGEWGPIVGLHSVLYYDAAVGEYAKVGDRPAQPKGIMAY